MILALPRCSITDISGLRLAVSSVIAPAYRSVDGRDGELGGSRGLTWTTGFSGVTVCIICFSDLGRSFGSETGFRFKVSAIIELCGVSYYSAVCFSQSVKISK